MRHPTVLISGAGIAGPSLAFWLMRGGFVPTLIEQAQALRTGGYLIDFWGAGYSVAEKMGPIARLRRDSYPIDELRFVNARGRRMFRLCVDPLRASTGNRFLSLRRADLAQALYEQVQERVETRFDDSVASLQQHGDKVNVTFSRGPAQQFDLVVGADGLHSQVRRLAFGPEGDFERRLGYVVAAFLAEGYSHRDERAYVSYTQPGRQIARFAMRTGATAFFMFVEWPRGQQAIPRSLKDQKTFLYEAFDRRGWECDEILARLASCNDLYFDDVSQIRMPHWSQGRVTLVGDAACCPSLLAGQGASFAMAGGYLLAHALTEMPDDIPRALENYERRLKPLVERKQNAAIRLGSWFAPHSRLGLFFAIN